MMQVVSALAIDQDFEGSKPNTERVFHLV